MDINEIAKYVWDNSLLIDFGESDQWDLALFTTDWSKSKPFKEAWKKSGPGWYWYAVRMSYDDMHEVSKPSTLPENGCNIGHLSHENREVFGNVLLCRHSEEGNVVIYNGHEANVTSRIRAHFALANNKTGALGLKHYPLSIKKWQVRYFSTPCFTNISCEEKTQIEFLMNSYSGRCAVESAWRVENGWPILCKG